ncbi:cellulose biosynthesis protein BcsD [Salinicola avicenniae]|uniref:cellulose biosynthesis protein BcsD n=1 Tax=Salinicola avicenniae TaxID=2916836 RepID=UPI002073C532|nr:MULTISPECIES: cellulose biosynthesis protein BcsD [unclassified Salinicola]
MSDAHDAETLSPGRTLLNALLTVIQEPLSEEAPSSSEHDEAFLHRVGLQMARQLPLGAPATLRALEHIVNRRLGELDWGWCLLRDHEQYLLIEHGDVPTFGLVYRDAAAGMGAIIAGLYEGWLATQGGTGRVRIIRQDDRQSLLFRYGGPGRQP